MTKDLNENKTNCLLKSGVSKPVAGGPLFCRVQLQPKLNTVEPANQGLIQHRNGCAEASWSYTLQDSGPPEPSLDTPDLNFWAVFYRDSIISTCTVSYLCEETVTNVPLYSILALSKLTQ